MPAFLSLLYPQLAIGLCNVHTTNAEIDASPVNECSSIKLQICKLQKVTAVRLKCEVCKTIKRNTQNYNV